MQRQILQLRAQIDSPAIAQRLIDKASPNAGLMHILALLSGALPDGTWLADLTVNGDIVALDGQSSNAASLISALTATPGLRNVSFTAPVTRAREGDADVFSIQLSVSR